MNHNVFLVMPSDLAQYVDAVMAEIEQQAVEGSRPANMYKPAREVRQWLIQNQQQKDVDSLARIATALGRVADNLPVKVK